MINIYSNEDIDQAFQASETTPILIYKHSPICHLCDLAILEVQKFIAAEAKQFEFYQVDVIAQRPLSQLLEQRLNVLHESPQLLLVWKSICRWNLSHRHITQKKIKSEAELFLKSI